MHIFKHPQANREAVLAGVQVAFALQRSQRRSIGFSVAQGVLSVRAPQWLSLADIDQAVQEKSRWIVQKLQQTQTQHLQVQKASHTQWAWGQPLAYLGQFVVLTPMRAGKNPVAWLDKEAATLYLPVLESALPEKLQAAAQRWLQQEARLHFSERLDFFAPQLRVHYTCLALSNARTRWGSASSKGAIRLNWRLIQLAPRIIDYVVVHELSHLRHMNHSAQFWACVQSVLPDVEQLRQQLRQCSTRAQ